MSEARKGETRRAGKHLNYGFLLLLSRNENFTVKEIHKRLTEHGYDVSLATLYNWSRRYKRADREAREMGKAL